MTYSFIHAAHRTKSYPHSKGSRGMSKSSKKEDTSSPTSPISDSDNGGGYGNDTISRHSNFSSYADYTSRDVSEDIDDDEPPLSIERVAAAAYRDDDVK